MGGSARSTFEWWKKDHTNRGRRCIVGTAYIIDRDGTIHEVFDPSAWAFWFGLDWPASRQLKFEQRFIGIEMAGSPWGLTTVSFDEGDTLGLEYLAVPAWFTETFFIDHQNAES